VSVSILDHFREQITSIAIDGQSKQGIATGISQAKTALNHAPPESGYSALLVARGFDFCKWTFGNFSHAADCHCGPWQPLVGAIASAASPGRPWLEL